MMSTTTCLFQKQWMVKVTLCFILIALLQLTISSRQQDLISLKTEPITIKLLHKFGSNQQFQTRGSLLVRPRSEFRPASASIQSQVELTDSDLAFIKQATEADLYYLKIIAHRKKDGADSRPRSTQTVVKACSLLSSNLGDIITVNLSPWNDFINVNLHTDDRACDSAVNKDHLPRKFNTTVLVESGLVGPVPDTATYIKRIEEERQSKLKEGKEDNRSFFAKYWIYIVPAIVILMVFGGPGEQGGR